MSVVDRLCAMDFSSQPPDIKKAKIEILDLDENKIEEDIEVLFNPAQYTLTGSAVYDTEYNCSKDMPIVMFKRGKAATLSMELFFDTGPVLTASGTGNKKATDVSKKVIMFEQLIYIHGKMHSPPVIKFIWGSLSFKGVVTQFRSSFIKFTESGMPIQAKVSLSLMAYNKQKDARRKSPFESPDRTKCRTVREDYSIWDMAKNEYGDISKWRVIARANNISNPLEIPPGTIIKIPAL